LLIVVSGFGGSLLSIFKVVGLFEALILASNLLIVSC